VPRAADAYSSRPQLGPQGGERFGIAALSTIATTRTENAIGDGASQSAALVTGFQGAFIAGVIVAAIGIVASLVLIRRDELEQPVEDLEPVLDLAA
jgi:hypothetical protein